MSTKDAVRRVPYVMILGAGQMQYPAIARAKEMGLGTLVVDANPGAPFATLADDFRAIDLKDVDGLVECARDFASSGRLVGVFTAGTDFSLSVAKVAEACGLPGVPPEAAFRASDKGAMRKALAEAGIPCPDFRVVDDGNGAKAAFREIGGPVVVKPADSMGARGCVRVDSEAEAGAAAREAIVHSRTGRVVVERYVDGPEFSIDALVVDGKLVPCGIADRHVTFAPYFVEIGHTMPSAFPEDVLREVMRVFSDGVRALGIVNGAAKGDMKFSGGKAWVGEIAARLSGGYMSGWTFPYSSGVDLTGAAITLACGGEPGPLEPRRSWTSAERALVSIPGRVRGISGVEEARKEPYVKDVFLRASQGSTAVFPRNNVEKCGNVISQAPARDLATTAAERAVGRILLRLEPCVDETDAFLVSGDAFPPWSFALPDAERSRLDAAALVPACLEPGVPLVVDPPTIAPSGRGWHGERYEDAALVALGALEGRIAREGEKGSAASAGFWRSLAKGGAQAAVYFVDTLRERSRK